MLTPAEPGDYNGDGDVAADDYALWRGAFGTADAWSDGNGNGGADAADYVMWRAHAATQATAGLSGASGTNVPEPTASCLALVMLLTLNSRPRRAHNSSVYGRIYTTISTEGSLMNARLLVVACIVAAAISRADAGIYSGPTDTAHPIDPAIPG